MRKLGWFLALVGVLLFAVPAAANPITIHYIVYAPAYHNSGIYQITNAPGSYDVVDLSGTPGDLLVDYNLTLTIAPLPPGATLISAWLVSAETAQPVATSAFSSVTPVSPGPFEAAQWHYYVVLGGTQGDVSVGGSPAFSGSVVFEDIGTAFAAQLAAGTTIQAYWPFDYHEHGSLFGYEYPGFNAQTQFTWELNDPAPALLQLDITYQPAPVPEPGTLSLLCVGLLGLSRIVLGKAKR